MDARIKYEVISALALEERPNYRRAACKLGCCIRQVYRMLAGYREMGEAFFVHGNTGRKPAHAIPDELRERVVELYRSKYYGANFAHFKDLLEKDEGISLSMTSVFKILEARHIYSPKIRRAKKKRIRKQLRAQKLKPEIPKPAAMEVNVVDTDSAHPRRPRAAYPGELQQMDASPYEWIPGQIWHLHLAIDDATGSITGAWFDTQETLQGYYHVLDRMLRTHGIPCRFFTDRRTVFIYKKKNAAGDGEDTFTQFGYACKHLGIELASSSVPQAKGRVERLNQTLQSRLPIELRLAGITSIDDANEFLIDYVREFNERFAVRCNRTSVWVEAPDDDKINKMLAVICDRTVDAGHCIKMENRYYRLVNNNGVPVCYKKGTKVLVIKAFDGNRYCCVNDQYMYALEEVPEWAVKSKYIDADYTAPKPRKVYIPPMDHPWKKKSWNEHLRKQKHRA